MAKSPNIEDQLWRAQVRSEQLKSEGWSNKWGWLLDEYEKLHNELDEYGKTSKIKIETGKKKPPETRSIKPLANTTSHECGWLASRREFCLERFGPDVSKGMPFVSLYED